MSCCNNNSSNQEGMLIVNKTREAAACAQANCASSFTNATNAATSATNAANSAVAAAASAAAAATSETNTENLWEQFNALYLGSFAVAPTTDNEGNPLQEGALYWNSVTNEMFVWNGSAWTPDAFNQFTNFTATGTTTARNLVTRFADVVNVKDFGAVGDGVANDTVAIQAAINRIASIGSGTVYFPHGTFLVTSGFLITTPVTFVGDGNGWYTWGGVTATTGTTIKYDGPMAPDPYVFKFLNIGGGSCGIKDIYIDCNGKANIGVVLDGLNGGLFENVSIRNPQNVCLTLVGTTHTCSWNTFTNLRLESLSGGKGALWLQGYAGQGNACHNTFTNTQINFGGAQHGIILGGCDNNNFYSTYIWCFDTGVTGYGVYCDTTEQPLFPVNNTFYALQASVRGWYQNGAIYDMGNQIFGYQLDNGQPLPITNGGPLTCVTDRGTYKMSAGASIGRSFGSNFCGTISIPAGVTSLVAGLPSGAEPNTNYAIFLSSVFPNIMPQYTISAQTTTTFTISFATTTPDCACEFLLIRK